MRILLPAAVAMMSLSFAGIVSAQNAELRPGARVRITAPGMVANHLEATIVSRTEDTIEVAGPALAPLKIPLARISQLEISRGKSAMAGAATGAKWAFAIGAPFGALVAATAEGEPGHRPITTRERVAFATSFVIGMEVWGVAIGAAVGAERWEKIGGSGQSVVTPIVSPTRVGMKVTF